MQRAGCALPIALLIATTVTAQNPAADSVRRHGTHGYTVAVIDTTDPALNTAPTLAHALQARLPGVSVSQGQGITGSSARVLLRGPSSFTVNEPLLIIDGARTHASAPTRFFGNRDLPSRLEDIDMETVERVDVLLGPAATAIHGPGASKGVILLTTKRGRPGPARWTAFAESGPSFETTAFPTNFGTLGVSTTTGLPMTSCPLLWQAGGSCTPTSRRSFNPLETASPFRTGWTNGGGLTVSGSRAGLDYFVAGSHDRANGVYETDHSRAMSGRVNLSASPAATVDIRLTVGHRNDRLRHPGVDWIQAGLLGESADDPVGRGYAADFSRLSTLAREEEVQRTTAALNTTWRPRQWLRTLVVIGYDRLAVENDFTWREGLLGFPQPSDSATLIERSSDRPETRTATVEATASYGVRGMAARSTAGVEYLRANDRGHSYEAIIRDGDPTVSTFEERSGDLERASTGLYLQQHIAWNGRLFITGSLRADRSRILDTDLDIAVSPSVDVSWTGIDSLSPASSKWLGDLRLRAAYGRGGSHALFADDQQSGGFGAPSSTETSEEGSEFEAGVDASLLTNRVLASVTYYRATTHRGLVLARGVEGRDYFSNGSQVRTSGVESSIDAGLVTGSRFTWDIGVILTAHESDGTLTVPSYSLDRQFVGRPAKSIGEYFAAPYTYADANGDGLLAASEIVIASGEFLSVGSPFPDYEAALRTAMTFGGSVHLSAILDRRAGARLYNATAALRCRSQCEEQNDPATSLAVQSRAAAGSAWTSIAYIEDADYTKLREVRLALTLSPRVARMGGVSSARVTLTGRNLYTWTPYSGLDPEIISGRYDVIQASDTFYQPTLRSFTARLDLVW